jgi:hypothetical protein
MDREETVDEKQTSVLRDEEKFRTFMRIFDVHASYELLEEIDEICGKYYTFSYVDCKMENHALL